MAMRLAGGECRVAETAFTVEASAVAQAAARAGQRPYSAPRARGARTESPATAAALAEREEAVGCWALRLASDAETRSSRFIDYLLKRFQSLAAAWEALDPQMTGELSRASFLQVLARLEYCRNSEARRLFEALPKKEPHRFTWRDLGLSSEDWVAFITARKWTRLQAALEAQKRRAGDGARKALATHKERQRKGRLKVPQIPLVFGQKPPDLSP